MKQLKLRTVVQADWWAGLSDQGKADYIESNPNSSQARKSVRRKLREQDAEVERQEQEACEQRAELERQQQEQQKREQEEAQRVAAEKARPSPPVRAKAPPPDTSVPGNAWEHSRSRRRR